MAPALTVAAATIGAAVAAASATEEKGAKTLATITNRSNHLPLLNRPVSSTGPWAPRCVSTLGRPDRHGLDRLGPLTHARAAWSAVRSPHSIHPPSVLSTSPGMGSGRADCSLNQISLQNQGWMMDSDALGHMSSTDLTRLPPSHSFITVGNGHTIPVSCRGTSILPASHFLLNNVLVVPLLASTCYLFASLLARTTVPLSLTLLVFL